MQRLTIELSDPVFRTLTHVAALTQKSPEQLAAQSIMGNLPPSFENAPDEMHPELLAMQTKSIDELRKIADGQMSQQQQQRLEALLEKNCEGSLSPKEQQELRDLRLNADCLMLRKAYAWAILRWYGCPVPSLDDLPLEY